MCEEDFLLPGRVVPLQHMNLMAGFGFWYVKVRWGDECHVGSQDEVDVDVRAPLET
jgi:hypothetical protein